MKKYKQLSSRASEYDVKEYKRLNPCAGERSAKEHKWIYDRACYARLMGIFMLLGVVAASVYLTSCANSDSGVNSYGAKGYGADGYSADGYSTDGYSAEYIDGSENQGFELSERIAEDPNLDGLDTSSITIVIDSGHGGIDPGKTGNGVNEKDINLEIATKLSAMLDGLGYRIVMTRTADEGLYSQTDTNKKRQDLKRRCEIANSTGADIMISIHQNSFSSSEVYGAQVFYYTYSTEGKRLADILQQSFKTNLDSSNTRSSKSDKSYYLLINSKIPTVIAECGFLTNADELARLVDSDYQTKIAEAIVLGVNQYFAGR